MLETLLPISAAVLIFSIVASITTTQASTVANDSTLVVNTSPSENRIRDFPNRHFHRIIEVKLVVVQLLKYKYDVFINK